MDRIARGAAGAASLLALWALLGDQGARLGSLEVRPISPWWIPAALGLVLWLTPPRSTSEGRLGRRALAALALFFLSWVLLTVWRSRALHPRASLEVLVDSEVRPRSVSLQIERRNELRRLTGRRRNVSLEAKGPHCLFIEHRANRIIRLGEPPEPDDDLEDEAIRVA